MATVEKTGTKEVKKKTTRKKVAEPVATVTATATATVMMASVGVAETAESKPLRGFEVVTDLVHPDVETILPTRNDKGSAGYDFYLKEDIRVPAWRAVTTATDVKAFMQEDECLELYGRSSLAVKQGLMLRNGVAVIDSSYYEVDGNIQVCLQNLTNTSVFLHKGDRIAQGVFKKYLTTGDSPEGVRTGGVGSSGN